MGTNLRSYKNKAKGKVLSDGGPMGGKGQLTDVATDILQNYYGAAIHKNQNNLVFMKSAIWAIITIQYLEINQNCLMNNIDIAQNHQHLGVIIRLIR